MIGVLLGFGSSGSKEVGVTSNFLFGGASSPGTASTDYISVTQKNLITPITYSWTRVSGSTNISVSNFSGQTVRFFGYISHGSIIGVWKCTVTDSTGTVLDTPTVSISFEDYNV